MDEKNSESQFPIQFLDPNQNDFTSKDSTSQQDETLETQKQEIPYSKNEDVLLNMSDEISELVTELASLKQIIEERLRYDRVKEEAFDRLYQELDQLKRNNIFDKNRSLYIDLILLFDRVENIRIGIKQSSSIQIEFTNIFKTLADELLEMLYRQGIKIIIPTSTLFDRSIQQAISIELTSVETENNQIARVLRKGFRSGDHIIRAEEVIVKKFQGLILS